MKCPSCGIEIPDGSNFCSHCGNAVSVQGKVAPPAAGAPSALAASPSADSQSSYIMSPPLDETKEQTLWDEYPSMRTAMPGIVMWILGGAAVILALNFLATGIASIAQLVISAVIALIVVGVLIRYYVRLHSIRYRLSTQRIFITYGLFNKRTDEVELEKYKDVFVNQDFWDKIVGCGDIEVVTGDVTNPTIKIIDVVDPIGKKESIRAAARDRKSMLGINRREEL